MAENNTQVRFRVKTEDQNHDGLNGEYLNPVSVAKMILYDNNLTNIENNVKDTLDYILNKLNNMEAAKTGVNADNCTQTGVVYTVRGSNVPEENSAQDWMVWSFSNGTKIIQYATSADGDGPVYRRTKTNNNNWTNWQKELSLDETYPVGSIYLSLNNTNPGDLIGGTWVLLSDGKFLKSITSENALSGSEGGTDSITLTASQLPLHKHHFQGKDYTWGWGKGVKKEGYNVYANLITIYGAWQPGRPGETANPLVAAEVMGESGNNSELNNGLGSAATSEVIFDKDGILTVGKNEWVSSKPVKAQKSINIDPPHILVYMWKRVS